MSNKTQLQTNNTALDGYIARINTAKEVAAGLPDAGGGSGGGGSVETCTLTIFGDAPVGLESKLWYTDGSSAVKSIALPNFGDSISVTVSKNSIVMSTRGGVAGTNATKIIPDTSAIAVFFISGDANITIM